jgi:hypothetical protein
MGFPRNPVQQDWVQLDASFISSGPVEADRLAAKSSASNVQSSEEEAGQRGEDDERAQKKGNSWG